MSDIRYINTQDIRKDLVGFLKSLESGQEVAVLNRSKVVALLNKSTEIARSTHGVKQILSVAEEIHSTVNKKKGALDPTESYIERYHKDMSKKYGVS